MARTWTGHRSERSSATPPAATNGPSSRPEGHRLRKVGVRNRQIRATAAALPNTARPRTRIVVAQDHRMFAEGLRAMLRGAYQVVACVGDGAEVVKTVDRLRPDLLLLDLSLPNRTGFDILRDLRPLAAPVRVVVVTMHVDRVLVDAAVRLGASGFVPISADLAELRNAIGAVLAGGRYLSPLLPAGGHDGTTQDRLGLGRLTPRQQEVVRLIGRGLHTEDIAGELGISVHTVNFHRKSIRKELGSASDRAVLRFAILAELGEDGLWVMSHGPGASGVVYSHRSFGFRVAAPGPAGTSISTP